MVIKHKPGWREAVADRLQRPVLDAERFVDNAWRRLTRRLGLNQPRHICAYHGYATGNRVLVRGRVLANAPYRGPRDDDDWWDNLRATFTRWESDEIVGAQVALTCAGTRTDVTTDAEGYYDASLVIPRGHDVPARVTAEHDIAGTHLVSTHRIFAATPQSQFMIISDLDDTVIHTGLTQLLLAAQLTFLHNAKTRKPLLGAAALYRALHGGGSGHAENPLFYVSDSPWNLFDLLDDFLELNDIPPGPLLLRDLGLENLFGHSEHKLNSIRTLLRTFPKLSVVLIGDSGQKDTKVYGQIVDEFPGRVPAVFIRDVDPDHDSDLDAAVDALLERHATGELLFRRVRDSLEIAAVAAELGFITPDAVADVRRAVVADTDRAPLAPSPPATDR